MYLVEKRKDSGPGEWTTVFASERKEEAQVWIDRQVSEPSERLGYFIVKEGKMLV
jgi:hypothetical protein